MLLGNLFVNSSGTFIGGFHSVRVEVTLHSSNGVEMPVHMGTRHTELPCYHPVSGSRSYSGSVGGPLMAPAALDTVDFQVLEDLRLNPARNSHLSTEHPGSRHLISCPNCSTASAWEKLNRGQSFSNTLDMGRANLWKHLSPSPYGCLP